MAARVHVLGEAGMSGIPNSQAPRFVSAQHTPGPRPPAFPYLEGGLRPYCQACGWRKGGADSWDGRACKCGEQSPSLSAIADAHDDMAERAETMGDEVGSAFHATRASELRAPPCQSARSRQSR